MGRELILHGQAAHVVVAHSGAHLSINSELLVLFAVETLIMLLFDCPNLSLLLLHDLWQLHHHAILRLMAHRAVSLQVEV